jgi:hypothetical protein
MAGGGTATGTGITVDGTGIGDTTIGGMEDVDIGYLIQLQNIDFKKQPRP